MIDSTLVSVKELFEIGQSFHYAKKVMAVQWFMANISLMLAVAGVVVVYFLYKLIPIKEKNATTHKKVTVKLMLVNAGLFIAGLIAFQFVLQMWGIILWVCMYSVGILMYLKWEEWFIKRDNKSIPVGWIYSYIAFAVVLIILVNVIPSMVGGNETVQQYFKN